MVTIRNYFEGAALGWTIDDHRQNGYSGYPGEDLKVGPGRAIRLPARAWITRPTPLAGQSKNIRADLADGRIIRIREVATFAGPINEWVEQGTIVGYTSSKWPHFELWDGRSALSFTAETAPVRPVPPTPAPTQSSRRSKGMDYIYNKDTGIWWLGNRHTGVRAAFAPEDQLGREVAFAIAGPSQDLSQAAFDRWASDFDDAASKLPSRGTGGVTEAELREAVAAELARLRLTIA